MCSVELISPVPGLEDPNTVKMTWNQSTLADLSDMTIFVDVYSLEVLWPPVKYLSLPNVLLMDCCTTHQFGCLQMGGSAIMYFLPWTEKRSKVLHHFYFELKTKIIVYKLDTGQVSYPEVFLSHCFIIEYWKSSLYNIKN